MKPRMVLDCNINMGGIDLNNQMLQPYLLECKKRNKLFKRLINVAIHNTMVFLMATNGNQKLDHLSLKMALIKGLTSSHAPAIP
jgi:hypothetical protein